MLIFNRKNRVLSNRVRELLPEDEPYTVYYEKIRIAEGLVLCAAGLYLISNIYTDPVHSFDGSFIWYLIFGFLFLAAGIPLCFICSGGCALITDKRAIIYRTRCFQGRTLSVIPHERIERACRMSAGRKGVVSAFFALVSALLKGDKAKAADMYDAAFLNGCLEIRTEKSLYRIRLRASDANHALKDIAQLCQSDEEGGSSINRRYSLATPVICASLSLAAVIIFGFTLTANAKDRVEEQYIKAVYLEDTEAFSLAYVEYAHLAERYDYRDSHFRSRYCYARLEMSQGNFARAVEQIKALPDFEDKKELLYHCALEVEKENSAALAVEIYTSLGNYRDSEQRIALIEQAYQTAIAAYDSGEYLTAAEGFSILRDYKQTDDYVSLLADEADKLVPNKGNPENLSSKEILKRCNEALPLLETLSWDSKSASIKALCEEYIEIYTFE